MLIHKHLLSNFNQNFSLVAFQMSDMIANQFYYLKCKYAGNYYMFYFSNRTDIQILRTTVVT